MGTTATVAFEVRVLRVLIQADATATWQSMLQKGRVKQLLRHLVAMHVAGSCRTVLEVTLLCSDFLNTDDDVSWLIRLSASHRSSWGSIPAQSVWNMWWTKWHWDTFFSEDVGFPIAWH